MATLRSATLQTDGPRTSLRPRPSRSFSASSFQQLQIIELTSTSLDSPCFRQRMGLGLVRHSLLWLNAWLACSEVVFALRVMIWNQWVGGNCFARGACYCPLGPRGHAGICSLSIPGLLSVLKLSAAAPYARRS